MARIALAILLLLAQATPAWSQRLADPYTRQLLDEWVAAVKTHVPGVLDQPAATPVVTGSTGTVRLMWVSDPTGRGAANPSFGVRIDEEARALGALDKIYVDGAVAVPTSSTLTEIVPLAKFGALKR